MDRHVTVHVGAPKTATTYVQDRLWRNAPNLASHGVSFAGDGHMHAPLFQFRAALDLVGAQWGGPGAGVEGTWDHLAEGVRQATGNSIVSHEVLASADSAQAARARETLGAGSDTHIVYSARDMWRQISAGWQEEIKQGKTWTFPEYCDRLRAGKGFFARPLDLPTVLDTWGEGLPADHVHIVTVPQQRGEDLWGRFCEALAIDPSWAPEESAQANPSLGAAETTVLRRLNNRLDRRRQLGLYDDIVRILLAEQTLAHRDGIPIVPSIHMHEWAEEIAETWRTYVTERGFHVIGDLDDLVPAPRPADAIAPKDVGLQAQLDVALDALAAAVREADKNRAEPPVSRGTGGILRAAWRRIYPR